MEVYRQQFEVWRPDMPPVWNRLDYSESGDALTIDILNPSSKELILRNIQAFTVTRQGIAKMMNLQ